MVYNDGEIWYKNIGILRQITNIIYRSDVRSWLYRRGIKDIGLKCGDVYVLLLISWKVGKSEVNSNLGIKELFKQKWCN